MGRFTKDLNITVGAVDGVVFHIVVPVVAAVVEARIVRIFDLKMN